MEACEIGIAIGIAIRIARTQTEGHAVIVLHVVGTISTISSKYIREVLCIRVQAAGIE